VKVIAIHTSPNVDGLTETLAKAALEGAQSAGAEIELVRLNDLDIRACLACRDGWGTCRTEGVCVQTDDFQPVRDKVNQSDGLVFCVPVYFHDISESAKSFLDRWRRCEWPNEDESVINDKPVIGVAAAGGSGGGAVKALQNLEAYFLWLRFRIFDLVPVTRFNRQWRIDGLKAAGRALVEESR